MSSLFYQPSPLPHQLPDPRLNSPMHSLFGSPSSSRKRKASEDAGKDDESPITSPSMSTQTLPRTIKRPRAANNNISARPLHINRLLETLDADSLRTVLRKICEQQPAVASEITRVAPRPSAQAALEVLRDYETKFQNAFPFGGSQASDYAYNRVRPYLISLLEAIDDFTPQYLPPTEPQTTQSLSYLDTATDIVHRLPDWTSQSNQLHKHSAYEELSKAWITVLQEAAKRAGGIHLQYDNWDRKILKHNELSNGRLQAVVDTLSSILGWVNNKQRPAEGPSQEILNLRQDLFNGTYGSSSPVRVGPW